MATRATAGMMGGFLAGETSLNTNNFITSCLQLVAILPLFLLLGKVKSEAKASQTITSFSAEKHDPAACGSSSSSSTDDDDASVATTVSSSEEEEEEGEGYEIDLESNAAAVIVAE